MNSGGWIDTAKMIFLTITYQDFYSGALPEGWESIWQDYCDTIHNPFVEVYEIEGDQCENNNGIPFYCNSCDSSFHVDTNLLNQMIDENVSFLVNSKYMIPRYNSRPTKQIR